MTAAAMPEHPGARRGLWALCAPFLPVLLIFLGSLAFALAKSSALERDMRIAATQNMLWVVTQTQMEVMALALATAAPGRDAAEIERRFDLTLSRLAMLRAGPQARYLDGLGHLDDVRAMAATLEGLDPLVLGHGAALHGDIAAAARDMQPQLNRIANDVMATDWNEAAARLDAYRGTQRLIILGLTFAFLSALAIAWRLLRNEGRLHDAEIARLRAAALLQQERDSAAMYRDFAAIVSHNMRTPLSLIDSAMHRLQRKGTAVTARDVAERRRIVGDAVGRLTRLVDTVLLLARLDNAQLPVRRAALPLARVVRAHLHEMRPRHPGRALLLSCGAGPLVACGDAHLVAHVIDNLVSNALKYSPPDRPVEVRVFAQGARIACAVIDRGPGIAPRDRPRLFERYFRGSAAACGGTGTGLGLALAQELAQAQGGRIGVESWPGRGSVFTLWLPAHRPGQHAPPAAGDGLAGLGAVAGDPA